MLDVGLRARRVDVGLREARGADRERVVGADQLDELARVLEAAVGLDPLELPGGGVAAQREHVVDPGGAHLVERRAQLADGGADAREVRHRLQSVVLLDALDDLDRLRARGAAGAVGDRYERRLERAQLGERGIQVALALLGLGGEELERERRLAAREQLIDPHRKSLTRACQGSAAQRSGSPAIRRACPRASRWVSIASVSLSNHGPPWVARCSRLYRRGTVSNTVSGCSAIAERAAASRSATSSRLPAMCACTSVNVRP